MKDFRHQVDAAEFLSDVARLVTVVMSGHGMSLIWDARGIEWSELYSKKQVRNERITTLRTVVQAHHARETTRLLISIAATLRVKLDDGAWIAPDSETYIGWLSDGTELDREKGEVLTLRETCNKIIHAEHVETEKYTADDGIEFNSPVVNLRGSRGGRPWTAEISLVEFAIAAANVDFRD